MNLCTTNIWFDYFEGIASILIALSTFIFALIINKKVSFRKQILEKQLTIVSELIKELQNIEFVIKTNDKINGISTGKCIPFFQMTSRLKEKEIEKFSNFKMFITRNFYENLPFMSYSRNPLTPKKIAQVIDKFFISFPYPSNHEKCDKYLFINFRKIKGDNIKQKDLIMNTEDEISKNFISFYNVCLELDKVIRVWLKKYGIKELNLK